MSPFPWSTRGHFEEALLSQDEFWTAMCSRCNPLLLPVPPQTDHVMCRAMSKRTQVL